MKGLLFRGDDAGGCESANLAVAQCLNAGLLKNVGVMACGLAFGEAARLLADRGDACFGLHVCLNAEWDNVKWGPVLPAEEVPNLVDSSGNFLATPMLNHERGLDLEQAMAEVKAQLAKLRQAGFKVSYIDQHMGVGWVGGLGEQIAELARQEGLVSGDGWPCLPPEDDGADAVTRFLSRIDAAQEEHALSVFHPGLDREDMRQYRHEGLDPGQVAKERQADTDFLCDPRLRRSLEARGIRALRFDQVAVVR